MIELPLWTFWILVAISASSVLHYFLIPSVRWFFRRKVNRMIRHLNSSLSIEIPPFKLTKRQSLVDSLICDPEVLDAAHQKAKDENIPIESILPQVKKYAKEIVPSFNVYFYFRVGYWLAKTISQSLFRVRLGYIDEESLKKVDPNSSVVFVINHRSNMDYILVSYFVATRTAISYAVGEWARIWPLQTLIKSMGAYFVRRSSGNTLYRKVLERYIQTATHAGVTQAVFLEGRLSRDGHLNPPKFGILDYLVRKYSPDDSKDIVLIPVGINYDRTLEDRTLLRSREKEGKKGKVKIAGLTFTLLFKNFFLHLRGKLFRYGYACVNFGTPISLKEYTQSQNLNFLRMDKEERFKTMETFGAYLMDRIGEIIPVLPVSLVSKVLVDHQEEPLSELELKVRVQKMMEKLTDDGVHVYIPRHDMDYAISVGLRMLKLRRLVNENEGLFLLNPKEVEIVKYYSNSLAHYF